MSLKKKLNPIVKSGKNKFTAIAQNDKKQGTLTEGEGSVHLTSSLG
jgi:hypothetical protein